LPDPQHNRLQLRFAETASVTAPWLNQPAC